MTTRIHDNAGVPVVSGTYGRDTSNNGGIQEKAKYMTPILSMKTNGVGLTGVETHGVPGMNAGNNWIG